jgi:hypothetical protein
MSGPASCNGPTDYSEFFAVEVFSIGLGVYAGERQGFAPRVGDIVLRTYGRVHRESGVDRGSKSVEDGLTAPLSNPLKNWSSWWTSAPISSCGFNAISTNWQFFAV